MGVVYAAEHVDIEREVALKILRFDLSQQPHMVRVFKDEAKAAGRLGSSHVVEIYDFGELPDGRLFIAMELLSGQDLVPQEGQRLPASVVLGVLRQVCKGLARAHRSGVIHRDVKPENIITTSSEGGQSTVKLVDFGISTMLAAGSSTPGAVAGTPHYMAPEQIRGDDAFDGRLDIYALGCTAYELLTGTPPFDADTVDELLHAHLHQHPLPITVAYPGISIPLEIEAVIMRCLAKDPDHRFKSMEEFEAALCEAQIASGITTDWDFLPIPEIADLERKERLRLLMATVKRSPATRTRAGSAWFYPAALGLGCIALAVALGFQRPPLPVDELNALEALTMQARTAAIASSWVHPAPDTTVHTTALQTILALEQLPEPERALGRERARELRTEFSNTLTRYANELWAVGATERALTYYLDALVFDRSNPTAQARVHLDAQALERYIERAERGVFEPEDAVISSSAASTTTPHSTPQTPPTKPTPDEPSSDDPQTNEVDPVRTPASELLGTQGRDPTRSRQLTWQGQRALKLGQRSQAEALFNRAIAFDRTNAIALMGLSDVYFDTGKSQKAVYYAEQATLATPYRGGYHLKLGDAYFNVLRYRDALEHYRIAQNRGIEAAPARIKKVLTKFPDDSD